MNEIGSWFWITPEELSLKINKNDCFLSKLEERGDLVLTSSGRSAIRLVLEQVLRNNPQINRVAYIPPFSCDSVYEPFIKLGFEVKHLIVNERLEYKFDSQLQSIIDDKPALVLMHRYFGFDSLEHAYEGVKQLRHNGIIVVEDKTQSLYSDIPEVDADYYIGSLRKWSGVPDGGFALSTVGAFDVRPVHSDVTLESIKIEASLAKYEYLFNDRGEKSYFLEKYNVAEELLSDQELIFQIAPSSLAIFTNLDNDELKRRRAINFNIVNEAVKNIAGIYPAFDKLPNCVTPLYCPVVCENRHKVQQLLREKSIYAPIVWPKSSASPLHSSADFLYDNLLCIPIDQRYSETDMNRIVDVLKRYNRPAENNVHK